MHSNSGMNRGESPALNVHGPLRADFPASPFFSVVIPTLDEEYWLPRLLECLAVQTDRDFEVLVMDGGSTDGTAREAMKFSGRLPDFQFLTVPRGVSLQKNLGGRQAKGSFIIFFDADVMPEERFLELMKEKMIRHRLTMSTVWNRAECRHVTCHVITRFISLAMTLVQRVRPGAVGVCIVIQREFFIKIGGFDESVLDGEDWELTNRAAKSGAAFRVFRLPRLLISGRRFEKEGLWNMTKWFLRYALLSFSMGAVKRKVFMYQGGGTDFVHQRPVLPEKKPVKDSSAIP